jgi:putative aminopeptidase FrvX
MLLPVQATDDAGNAVEAWNVVAWLGPNAPDPVTRGPGRVVLLSAHHDHLGRGRTPRSRAREGEHGQVHPGADDNASGVAVVLNVTRRLAASPRRRGVVVAFFTAEELGGQGARAFLDATLTDRAAILGAVNVDMVGRLGDGDLLWNGGVHVVEWSGLLAASDAALPLREDAKPFGANDAEALRSAGIPVLDLTTALHEDYHRPTDTADKLDAEGLDRVADFVHGVAAQLVSADAPPFTP